MSLLVTAIGRLGSNLEEKQTKNGNSFKTFSLAIPFKSQNTEITQWIRCNIWEDRYEKLKGIFPYLSKGSLIIISGEITKISTYTDRSGSIVPTVDVSIGSITFAPMTKRSPDEQETYASRNAFNNNITYDDCGQDLGTPFSS